jgi:hypothetical protein
LKLSKGLVLLIAVAVAMFFAGFGGGVAVSPHFIPPATFTQYKVLLETVTNTTTVTVATPVNITVTTTAVITETVTTTTPLLLTTTSTVTLTVNMPREAASKPYARVARGSSVEVGLWAVSVASCYRSVEVNKTVVALPNNVTQVVVVNTTYIYVLIQMLNSAPWARSIDTSTFSKIVLVTNTMRSYEPAEVKASRGLVAPGSYGFIELKFAVGENEYPDYLYAEATVNNMVYRIEFEL